MGNSMKKEVQVIIEGRPRSGKSSALFQLKNGETLLTPTPGAEGFFVESLTHAGSKLNVWEVHSASVRDRCLATARALCFVVDCREDSAGIAQAKAELDSTLLTFALRTPRTCYTVLVLANKQDIAGALAPAKLERALDISSRSDGHTWRWRVQGCSATQGLGLKEGMDWLAASVRMKPPSAKAQRDTSRRGRGTGIPTTWTGTPIS